MNIIPVSQENTWENSIFCNVSLKKNPHIYIYIYTVGAIEGGGLVFRPGKIQFSRFFHKNLYLDSLGCPRMMYKIWLKNFENFDNFENFEKGRFFH